MKQNILKFGLIFVALATVFIACEQKLFEGNSEPENTMTVDEARAWYESNQPEFLVLKSGDKEKKTKVVKPKWDGASKSQNSKVEVVETHIESNGGFGFATEDNYNEWELSRDDGYITSLSRLVVLKYKKSGETVSFLMTIVGDKEYLESKDFKMWNNTYLKKDKDFNGLVLFHSLEGEFENGWRFTKGKPSHTVKMNLDLDIQLKSGHYECTTYNIYEMFVECTYLGITGEYGLL